MNRKLNTVGLLMLGTIFLNGCSKVNFATSQQDLGTLSHDGASLTSVTVNTKKNIPITFSAGTVNGTRVGTLSFASTPGTTTIKSANGIFKITDTKNYVIQYTPNESFVGSDPMPVYTTDIYGNSLSGSVDVNVGNTLNVIKPALAVRGISCITCHSGISSNIVTDYGYGNPWYFDTISSDSFYFDRLGSNNGLSTISMLNNSQIIVPKANVPSSIQTQYNLTTLAQFVQERFSESGINKATQVSEVNSLKINIPTASRIQDVFDNPSSNQAYIPDTEKSPALQGLQFDQTNNIFVISNLTCDGDLYLGATVLFENASVTSINGCRIYATKSIFVDGPLVSLGYQGSTTANTQLLSAISIWMGVGKINKNGSFCERDVNNNITGYYSAPSNIGNVDCTNVANESNPYCSTFDFRAISIFNRNTFSTAYPDSGSLAGLMNINGFNPSVADGSTTAERKQVEANLGRSLYDASCGPNGRQVSFSRLMLVAPYIDNRYTGDLSGATIAEAALMSLGTFTYQFDPVFSSVSIFSLLDSDELISGDGL